jgi:hypothetical protein
MWRWGNCLFYAVWRWLQEGPRDSYLIIRVSRVKWTIPHVMFAQSIEGLPIEEFRPHEDPPSGRLGRLRWLLRVGFGVVFAGYVRKGAGEPPRA